MPSPINSSRIAAAAASVAVASVVVHPCRRPLFERHRIGRIRTCAAAAVAAHRTAAGHRRRGRHRHAAYGRGEAAVSIRRLVRRCWWRRRRCADGHRPQRRNGAGELTVLQMLQHVQGIVEVEQAVEMIWWGVCLCVGFVLQSGIGIRMGWRRMESYQFDGDTTIVLVWLKKHILTADEH